jgi:ABC-2 type transport system permease protein/lipopolysaccharide transport system permease protein
LPSPSPQNLRLALKDLKEGVSAIYIWPVQGWLDIKRRYRRSILGPFWLTISTGVLIAAMGPLYGRLFGQDISSYVAYLALSLILWSFVAGLINDACEAFIASEFFIKQVRLPYTIYVMRAVWKNLLIFAHNLLIVVIVLVFLPPRVDWTVLLAPVGVLMIVVNGIWVGVLLGLVCARFRDISPIVGSVVQVAFFLTPVIWKPDMLGRHRWAADWNPLFHFLEIVRRPLLGQGPALESWGVALLVTAAGFALMVAVFSRYRARIAYWV